MKASSGGAIAAGDYFPPLAIAGHNLTVADLCYRLASRRFSPPRKNRCGLRFRPGWAALPCTLVERAPRFASTAAPRDQRLCVSAVNLAAWQQDGALLPRRVNLPDALQYIGHCPELLVGQSLDRRDLIRIGALAPYVPHHVLLACWQAEALKVFGNFD
jgi:hypothetical protein